MGFWSQYLGWLQGTLAVQIGMNTAKVAAGVEPVAVTCTTIYVMGWGYLFMAGRVQEPLADGLTRIFKIVFVMGCGIKLWQFNTVVVDAFMYAPTRFAHDVLGADTAVSFVDKIWLDGYAVGKTLAQQGGWGSLDYTVWGNTVIVATAGVCVFVAFLISISYAATSIILMAWPLFVLSILGAMTQKLFESYLTALISCALIFILLALVSATFLGYLQSTAAQALELGEKVTIAHAIRLVAMAGLVFFLLATVPIIAVMLSGGVALPTFGMMGRALRTVTGTAQQTGRGLVEGAMGVPRGKFDSVPRLGGSLAGQVVRGAFIGGSGSQGGTVSRDRVMPPRIVR